MEKRSQKQKNFGGLLLGYALKKVLKLITVIVGLFITWLAYLQYQQLATFNWDRIEGTISTVANATTNSFNDYIIETLPSTYLGIPLTSGMSAFYPNNVSSVYIVIILASPFVLFSIFDIFTVTGSPISFIKSYLIFSFRYSSDSMQ
jgi:uncharacterized membrane protein (Fun14 family)